MTHPTQIQKSQAEAQVPEGFKKTKLGVIPEEWEFNRLGSKCKKVGSGITPKGGRDVYSNDGRLFLRSQNVGWGNLLLDDVAFISERLHASFVGTQLKNDDVLLNITGASIGRSAIVKGSAVGGNVNQHVCIIRPVREHLDPKFLNLFLISPMGQRQIDLFQAGGNRQGLNFNQIRSFKIPIPPLPEQRAIADCLGTWDRAIEKLDQLIKLKEQRKKGLMQQLLTGKKRLPGFSGEWEEKRLKEIFDRVTRKNTELNDTVITISAQRGFVLQESFFNKRVASETLEGYFLVKRGEFCYNKSYSNGYPWGATKRLNELEKAVVTTLYICFKLKSTEINSGDFFEHFFNANSLDHGLMRIAHEGGRAHGLLNVTPSDFFNLSIKVPSHVEQVEISKVLTAADNELTLLNQQLDQLRDQKKGMMQQLLTGKKRLKIEND